MIKLRLWGGVGMELFFEDIDEFVVCPASALFGESDFTFFVDDDGAHGVLDGVIGVDGEDAKSFHEIRDGVLVAGEEVEVVFVNFVGLGVELETFGGVVFGVEGDGDELDIWVVLFFKSCLEFCEFFSGSGTLSRGTAAGEDKIEDSFFSETVFVGNGVVVLVDEFKFGEIFADRNYSRGNERYIEC